MDEKIRVYNARKYHIGLILQNGMERVVQSGSFLSLSRDEIEYVASIAPALFEGEKHLQLDEVEYMIVTAEIGFYRQVQTDVNNIVGYTTDALSVTNADKPYQYLSATIRELENKQRVLYYKMVRYSFI